MGEFKQVMTTLEDIASDAAREGAADAYHIIQDVMHEQRDMVREQIEINMLDYLSAYHDTIEMDDSMPTWALMMTMTITHGSMSKPAKLSLRKDWVILSKRYEYQITVYSTAIRQVFVVAKDEDEAWENIDIDGADISDEWITDMEIVDKELVGQW